MIRSSRIPPVLQRMRQDTTEIQNILLVTEHGELLGSSGDASSRLGPLTADLANDYQQLGIDWQNTKLQFLLLEMEETNVAMTRVPQVGYLVATTNMPVGQVRGRLAVLAQHIHEALLQHEVDVMAPGD